MPERSTQNDELVGESKLTYLDARGEIRALRGRVSIEGQVVRVERRDGTFIVPLLRVLEIEAWNSVREVG